MYPCYKSPSLLGHQSAVTSAIWHWTGKQHQQSSFKTAWITSLIFTKTTTQDFIVIISLYYKTYNSLYDVIVSLMLKLNCFKETKLYLPIIVLSFFIIFCMLMDFLIMEKTTKFWQMWRNWEKGRWTMNLRRVGIFVVSVQNKSLAHTVLLRAQVLNEANVCQVSWLWVTADDEKNVQFCISEPKIILTVSNE